MEGISVRNIRRRMVADRQFAGSIFLICLCGLCFGLTLCAFQLIGAELPPLSDLFGYIAGFRIMGSDKLGILKALRHLFRSALREVFFHSPISGHPQNNLVFGLQFIMRHQISPPIRASASSLYSGFNSIPT